MEMWPLNLDEIKFIQEREKKARQAARQEGRREALATVKRSIVKILRARFGRVPAHPAMRLDGCTRKQLTEIIVQDATAVSLDAALDLR